jgi:hypothetical protein
MSGRKRPRQLSEADVQRFLTEDRRFIRSNNEMSVRVNTEQYRAIGALNHAVLETAKIVAGTDRPWPV